MQMNLALIAKYFKKIYKPTNNNLRTSSNSRNKNVDTTPWYKNDNQSGQFGNQRTVNVARAKENECKKPKRVKDSAYHKEKMLLCKQAKEGVPLQAEQYDWLADTDEEIDEQELEAHYRYMAKIHKVPIADSGANSELMEWVQNDTGYNVFSNDLQHFELSESVSNTCLVETDDGNVIPDSLDMCEDDIQNEQNDVESDDERVALANLIANLKLDVDENKKIQNQLKKANTTLAQELKECKAILAETSKSLGESISVLDSCLVALQNKQTEFEKYKAFNDYTIDYDKLERKLNETLGQLAQKDIEIKEGLKTKAYELLVVKEKHDELIKQSLLTKSHYEGLVKQKAKVDTATVPQFKSKRETEFEGFTTLIPEVRWGLTVKVLFSCNFVTFFLALSTVTASDFSRLRHASRFYAHIGYNCPSKVPVISNPEPCNNQTIDGLPQALPSFHWTFHSDTESPFTLDSTPTYVDESLNVFNPPPQPPVYPYEFCENDAYYELSVCYDDEDYTSAITPDEPVLSTEELDNSLSMGDEHLDTSPATESDEFINSSVENLIPIPSESEGIPEHVCDVPSHDNSPPLDVLKDQFKDFSEPNEEFSSTDDDSFSFDKIDYVEASPPDSELVSSKVMEIVISKVGGIKASNDNPIPFYDPIISGTPPNLTPSRESDFFLEGDMLLFEAFLNDDHSSGFKTKSSSTSLNSLLEETNNFHNSLPEFTTFSKVLFDAECESDSSDDQSCSDEDVLEKIVLKPLSEEEIIPMESLRTHDSSLLISSKIDSLLDEFVGEFTLLKSIPPGIGETDWDFEEDIRLIEKLLYDNSSPRPPEEFVSANSDAKIKSFSPSPILVKDSDSLMEEIDLFCTPDYPMPPGIKNKDYDSERDILILKDFPSNNSLSFAKKESFHFDIPPFSRPPAKPPDGDT
uniref:Reverse transcriptase domain-containing protein n=1 Tax=Tanacetum cinerariifolium TaxID=118510 RepID=A0A6L2N308_TANCI|nr:hypothetical protein [Tanacetum cinerariifolium]